MARAAETAAAPMQLAVFQQQLERLRATARACAQKVEACDPKAQVPGGTVSLGSGGTFNADYAWFPDAMQAAKRQGNKARATQMDVVEARLQADAALAEGSPGPAVNFPVARKRADAILAERQFETAAQETLWERFVRWIFLWLSRVLMGVAAFGSRSPWIGPLIEWGLGALAAALLLVWILRGMRSQRMRMRLEAQRPLDASEERVLNWMQEAEAHAARGEYRDAVHCLYWASIAVLEGRRLWRTDRARTPREYLRLVEAGTQLGLLLRRQTQSFETIWYGLRPAHQADYDQALMLHRELRTA